MIKTLLRLEGGTIFLLCLFAYYKLDGNWLLFILLLFTPDISLLGYLRDNKVGALFYNLFHNFVIGILLLVVGYVSDTKLLILLGVITIAHVGVDRALGYGLKEASGFKYTHLGKIGK